MAKMARLFLLIHKTQFFRLFFSSGGSFWTAFLLTWAPIFGTLSIHEILARFIPQ